MKQRRTLSSMLSLALATGAASSALWSQDSHACATDPYYSAICIAGMSNITAFDGQYQLAAGQVLLVQQYQALFSLLGATYGGNGTTTFGVPDLRGRVIVGAGASAGGGVASYAVGTMGGATKVLLSPTQLPLHTHPVGMGTGRVAVSWSGSLTLGAVSTSGWTGSTTLGTLKGTVDASSLTLKAGLVSANATAPGGALAVPGSINKIYAPTPSVNMAGGSIGGTATVAWSGAPAATTLSGSATTSLTGTPAVTVSGNVDAFSPGTQQAVTTLPPYLVLNHYIAVQGANYPTPD